MNAFFWMVKRRDESLTVFLSCAGNMPALSKAHFESEVGVSVPVLNASDAFDRFRIGFHRVLEEVFSMLSSNVFRDTVPVN